jgi:hypothetical protein
MEAHETVSQLINDFRPRSGQRRDGQASRLADLDARLSQRRFRAADPAAATKGTEPL